MARNTFVWKNLLLLLSFSLIFGTLHASKIENKPAVLQQPDGSQVSCLLSGDEYYNWVSDTNGYTLLKNAQGWIVYATLADEALVPTEYPAYSIDPQTVGLQPYLNISAEKRTQIRANFINQTAAAAQLSHPAQAPPQNAPASNTYRAGTLNNIVIYISFPNANFTKTHSQIAPNFNGTIRGSSMQQYYKDISNNNFNINSTFFPTPSGTTILSYQAPHNRSYYEIDNDEPDGRIIEHTLLHDAVVSVQSAIEATFTGAQLDYNNDGEVDNIVFILQGNPGGWSTLLWAHRWTLYTYQPYYGNALYLNGKMVWDYNLVLENDIDASTLVHETYHTLGAPDLYRYQDNFNPVGSWDIMASNATPPQSSSAYVSNKYGAFLIDNDIQEITTSGTYTLYDIWDRTTGHKKACKIATSSPDEWIYLEYRKKTGEVYESNIPGEGIVIYRVKTSLNGNADGPPDEIYVYRPNASDNSTNGSLGSACFSSQSGRTTFSATSNPPCFLTNGSLYSNFIINNISASGGTTMTFNISFNAHSIVATASGPGAISPAGNTVVTDGNNQTFTFTPNSCGTLSQVLIDGVNNSAAVAAGSYTFNNVTANHTIEAVFTYSTTMSCQYTFIANDTYGDGWTIYPSQSDTAFLLIKQNGNTIHRLTAISRASSNTVTRDTLTVYLCNGMNYELWWDAPTGNYFPDEISFELLAPIGTSVYSASGAAQINALSTTSAFHSFATNCGTMIPPVVTTNGATNIQQTSATLNGSITAGSQTITARGFKYKTAASSAWLFTAATGTTTITATVTNLTPNTNYVFKAYAVTGTDSTFGSEQSFTALNIVPPVVTTYAATNIQQTSATLNGSITTGSQTITARGFKYKTAASSAWLFVAATGTTTITATVTNLTPNPNYVFKAYAVTGTDSTFGSERSFTTICQNYFTSQNIEICSGENYTFPDGITATNIISNTTHDSYFQTVAGCDSVIRTNVFVKTIDLSVINNGTTLTANQTGATYQWIDCNSGNSPISGASQRVFTPAVNGNYAVEIGYNGCTQISECVEIQITGIAENKIDNIQVYPNPADDRLIVEFSMPFSGFILLYQIDGKEVIRHATANKHNEIDINSLAKGIYLLKIVTEEEVCLGVRKVVK